METKIDEGEFELLFAERARRGIEARMRAEAHAHFGPWYRRRQRRNHMARSAIGMATAVAMVVIVALPHPDGQFLSAPDYRAQALYNVEQTLIAGI